MRAKKVFTIVAFSILFFGLSWGQTSRAQSAVEELIITDINAAEFPQINVRFRATDRLNRPVTGLMVDDMTVTEDSKTVFPESIQEVEEGV